MEADAETASQLVSMERQRLRLLVAGDIENAAMLHAEDFQLVTPSGEVLDKGEYMKRVAAGNPRYLQWEPDEISIRFYGESAVLRYQATIEAELGEEHVARGRYWHTDVYERRDGTWQVVWSQATARR